MKILAAAITVNIISLLSNIVGVAIPYWAYASQDDATAVRGLWHQCDIGQDAESIFCFAAYDTGWCIVLISLVIKNNALAICNHASPPPGEGGGSRGNELAFDDSFVTAVRGKYPGFALYEQKGP